MNTTPQTQSTRRRGPRSSTIVWGCLVLIFCGYIAQRTFAPGTISTETWVTASLIGLGALLLAVGVGVVVRNNRGSREN